MLHHGRLVRCEGLFLVSTGNLGRTEFSDTGRVVEIPLHRQPRQLFGCGRMLDPGQFGCPSRMTAGAS